MSRLNLLLLMVVIGCALSVVNSTNRQRQVFIDLERLQGQTRQLQQDYAQLQYQQSALSKTSRIESVATQQLKMQAVDAGHTQYLTIDPTTVSMADAPVAASGAASTDPRQMMQGSAVAGSSSSAPSSGAAVPNSTSSSVSMAPPMSSPAMAAGVKGARR
jgi:cell division protein FtsL